MYCVATLRLEVDRTVPGGSLGLGKNWRAVRQVSDLATDVESVELYLPYAKKVVRVLRVKLCCFMIINYSLLLLLLWLSTRYNNEFFYMMRSYVKYSSEKRCRRKFSLQVPMIFRPFTCISGGRRADSRQVQDRRLLHYGITLAALYKQAVDSLRTEKTGHNIPI